MSWYVILLAVCCILYPVFVSELIISHARLWGWMFIFLMNCFMIWSFGSLLVSIIPLCARATNLRKHDSQLLQISVE